MLLHTKNEDSEVVKQMESVKETKINPRVFGDQFHKHCNKANEKKMRMASKEETRVTDYKSFLSEFDDYVSSEKLGSGVSKKFEIGDMVWGKVKSLPWWPGQIFNEAFVTPSVRSMMKTGYVLVAFYGDNSYGWFDPSELIPFEPHFAEKSQQTNSSNFVKAVEEAIDEAGKRSALGLTCKCRNPHNFRASNVKGYFAVDVPDYELQAVYSSKQIKKAMDSFSSAQTLSFVKRCALSPQVCGSESLKFYQRKAAVYAFRRAVFEEFDETYDQAFGARSAYTSVKTQEPVDRATPRVPLSGPLVIAETVGDPTSFKDAIKVKDSTKQDKYLPKRRKKAGDMTVQFGQVQASSQLQGVDGSSAGEHVVLQRKTPYLQTPMKHEETGLVSMDITSASGDIPGKESSISKLSRDDDKGLDEESKARMGEKAELFPEHEKFEAITSLKQDETSTYPRSNICFLHPFLEEKNSAGAGIKKVNVLKRSSEELDSENASSELKKKMKKKKESGSELNRRRALSFKEAWAKKSSQLDAAERQSDMLTVRNSKPDVVQLLSNLQALSLDPFFGSSDGSSIRAVKQFFLRFRSLVYHKKLAKSPSTPRPSKSAKTLNSTNEPSSKADKKRLSSDHQQDIPSIKKLKETSQLKPMASDKKTNEEAKKRSNLAPFIPVRDRDGPVPMNAKAQPGKNMAPPSTKVVEPTMLVMKLPPGTSLPSTALLKARFGRFGMLDQSATRVFWKSSICRVVFMYKLDAQTAFRYASGSNSLFGNVNVTYSLRDVKASSAPECPEPKKAKTDEPSIEPPSQMIERAQPLHQPNIQLKSCLKKPSNNGIGSRGTARVKFMLDGKETETPFPVLGRNNGNYGSSSSTVAMEFVSKNTENIVPSTLPLILPLHLQNSKPKPVNSQVEPPLDISQEMMKLLLRCNDVVANVTGLLGYVPYHPL